MRQPDPQDWYNDPSKAKTAGFAVNNSQVGVFDFYKLVDAQNAIMTDETRYNATRKLFATPLDFYIEINLTPTKGSLNEGNQISLISIGKNPINAKAKEIAIVKRGVVVREKRLNDQPGSEQEEKYDYHYGTLTLILWTNKSNI
jgi:hypothetical protein